MRSCENTVVDSTEEMSIGLTLVAVTVTASIVDTLARSTRVPVPTLTVVSWVLLPLATR